MGKEKVVCARVVGGLGNQLFIYGFARAYTLKNNFRLIFDNKTGFIKDAYGRSPKLNKYISGFPVASGLMISLFYLIKVSPSLAKGLFKAQRLTEPDSRSLFEIAPQRIADTNLLFVEGYFQSYKYMVGFEDQIRNDIRLEFPKTEKVKALESSIRNSDAVSIHVRRMQYDNMLGMNYYTEAIKIIESKVEQPVFYVFSDDMEWCRANFPASFIFISHDVEDEVADLWLMTLCKHNIIANSSFSWWGAWLSANKNKVVIAPYNTDIGVRNALYPDNWTSI